MKSFVEIAPEELLANPFKAIGRQWMLVSAGTKDKHNTMTASWGGIGVMWNLNVAYVVIRPQRYTKEFMDACDSFSLSFLGKKYRKTLSYLGTVSGRDEDKVTQSGLQARMVDGVPCFQEAEWVMICRKLFAQPLAEDSFLARELLDKWYPERDLHTLYIAEITKILQRQ